MRSLPLLLMLHMFVLGTFIWFTVPACADSTSDYKAGADYAKQIQGSGTDALKNFNGADTLPGYTSKPAQTKYYGGISASGDSNLKSDSAAEWASSDVGNSITESFTNRPPDSISADAPFIQAAKETESRADSIVGNTGQPGFTTAMIRISASRLSPTPRSPSLQTRRSRTRSPPF